MRPRVARRMAELNFPQKTLIVLAGPTAVGKTRVSIELAQQLRCPILSYDSRQCYRELTIGTAPPTPQQRRSVPHHFIHSRSVDQPYTSGQYELDALQRLETIFDDHQVCVAVGGSGLYIHALCYGIDPIPSDEGVRQQLNARWRSEGLESLQEALKAVDPAYFATADVQNPRRLIRALEVCQLTGGTYSSLRKQTPKKRPFATVWIGLTMDRDQLYRRIEQRVDGMMAEGLVEEARSLFEKRHLPPLKTVGYQELFAFFDGAVTLERAVEQIKRNSRRYAKRQLSWFGRNEAIAWCSPDHSAAIQSTIRSAIGGGGENVD